MTEKIDILAVQRMRMQEQQKKLIEYIQYPKIKAYINQCGYEVSIVVRLELINDDCIFNEAIEAKEVIGYYEGTDLALIEYIKNRLLSEVAIKYMQRAIEYHSAKDNNLRRSKANETKNN